MNPTRAASLEWTRQALAEELPPEHTAAVATRAEKLVAIAEHNQIPIELLVQWIHLRSPQKQWSPPEWTRWCDKYVEARAGLLRLQEASDWRKLCPNCWNHVALRNGDVWLCPSCGAVEHA